MHLLILGFHSFHLNQIIDANEAAQTEEIVQLVVGGYLWRVVCGELCDHIEIASLENSPYYRDISTSFELSIR